MSLAGPLVFKVPLMSLLGLRQYRDNLKGIGAPKIPFLGPEACETHLCCTCGGNHCESQQKEELPEDARFGLTFSMCFLQ